MPPQPPPLPELRAAEHWRSVDFISDLHLSEATPRSTEAWATYLTSTDADAVFMLGDVFEVWVGDDAADETGSFEARCAEILREAAERRPLAFMDGNRDFLLGPDLLRRCDITGLHDPTLLDAWGQRVLLTHGDLLCLSDTEYQAFRRQVRSEDWRREFLALPLGERRRRARAMRDASRVRQQATQAGDWADVDAATAVAWLQAGASVDMVHGHTHRPADESLAPGFVRHVLSDWDLEATPPRSQVLRLTRAGFTRYAP